MLTGILLTPSLNVPNETYEYTKKLNPPRGKINDYLAINLDYTTSGEVEIYTK